MRVRVTERSAGLLASIVAVALVYAYTRDLILGASTALLSAVMVIDLLVALSGSRGEAEVLEPPEGRDSLWVWEEREVKVLLRGATPPEGLEDPRWLRIEGVERSDGNMVLKLRASFRHSGLYRTEGLTLLWTSPLGLYRVANDVKARLELKVLPRALYLALIAMGVLAGERGARGLGLGLGALEEPSMLRSLAGTYYETREYAPGDPFKRIDWKATSRLQKLMVKEYREEASGGASVVVDYRCLGPYTCDAIASALLTVALSLARAGMVTKIIEVPEGRAVEVRDPRDLLRYALGSVIRRRLVGIDEVMLYEHSAPLPRDVIRRILSKLHNYRRRVIYGRETETEGPLVAVSALVNDVDVVVDLVSSARRHKDSVSLVLAPARPWIDLKDLEEAYRVLVSFRRSVRSLRSLGAKVLLLDPAKGWRRGA